jgi:hypothetical protein
MSEREPFYHSPYLNDHSPYLGDQSSLLFMASNVCRHMLPMFLEPGAHHPQADSFPVGGGQDAQQVVPPMPINPYPSTHSPVTTSGLQRPSMTLNWT